MINVIRRLTLLMTLLLATPAVWSQPKTSALPRLSNGKPDFNGIWQALSPANYDVERHMARPSLMLRQGPHGPLPAVALLKLGAVGSVPGSLGIIADGGAIPYKPKAQKKREENRANWLERDPEIRCYMPGVPRANYMPFPFQILQNPNQFFITYEYAGAFRDVYFKNPGPAETDSWMGQSVGRWEGDTLVVDTINFKPQVNFRGSSQNLHVIERFTKTDANTILYTFTIDDPTTWTKSWRGEIPLRATDERLYEYACHEANYGLEGVLRGARAQEQRAAETAPAKKQ